MKYIYLRLLIALLDLLIFNPESNGQYDISYNHKDLKSVLNEFKKQTGKAWVCTSKQDWFVPLNRYTNPVSVSGKNLTLVQYVDSILQNQPFHYSFNKDSFLILEPLKVRVRVYSLKNKPLPDVMVQTDGYEKPVYTGRDGYLELASDEPEFTLYLSGVSVEPRSFTITGRKDSFFIFMRVKEKELQHIIFDGYHTISNERAAGSYLKIGTKEIGRSFQYSIVNRLLLSTGTILSNPNSFSISIRGIKTLQKNAGPLFVVDGFPYENDYRNINPNDVSDIDLLKDASAGSIWGDRAGHGVVVFSLKHGKYKTKMQICYNQNMTLAPKPDIFYLPVMNPVDIINLQDALFRAGFYQDWETDPLKRALPPVVEVAIMERDGLISSAEAGERRQQLKMQDTRREKERYFFQNSLYMQRTLDFTGGGKRFTYYVSGGYDQNQLNERRRTYDRATATANLQFSFSDKMKIDVVAMYLNSVWRNNIALPEINNPYGQLKDKGGNAAVIDLLYRKNFTDSVTRLGLKDWSYRPLNELYHQDYLTRQNDIRLSGGIKYDVFPNVEIKALALYQVGITRIDNYFDTTTFLARNSFNQHALITTNGVKTPVEWGNVRDKGRAFLEARGYRIQVGYDNSDSDHVHTFSIILGGERWSLFTDTTTGRQYGLDANGNNPAEVDYENSYPLFVNKMFLKYIDGKPTHDWAVNNYLSVYLNAAYTINHIYTLTSSIRKDWSNIFGEQHNKNTTPLWSAGVLWRINRESFYNSDKLSLLHFRATFGYNGNINKQATWRTTLYNSGTNSYGQPSISIDDPRNERIRWEKIRITNFGLDFIVADNLLRVNADYYFKKSSDLFWEIPIDPTTGTSVFNGNGAGIEGHGIEINLNFEPVKKPFTLTMNLNVNHVKEKVTGTKNLELPVYLFCDPLNPVPVNGDAPNYVYSLPTASLDPLKGNARGYLDGQISDQYDSIVLNTDVTTLVRNGPAYPTLFGNFSSDIVFNRFYAGFIISYKLGYFFRRPSVDYDGLLNGTSFGHPDYYLRWQQPGDEKKTMVPAFRDYVDNYQNLFYKYSESLVERGDHVRLQLISIGYDLVKPADSNRLFSELQLKILVNNPGIIWRANHFHIDPDFINFMPQLRSYSIGIKVRFNNKKSSNE